MIKSMLTVGLEAMVSVERGGGHVGSEGGGHVDSEDAGHGECGRVEAMLSVQIK